MATSDAQKRATARYKAAKMKRVPLDVQKRFYEQELKPAADRAGEPVNTYIKAAIAQRIERERGEPPRSPGASPPPIKFD